MDNIADEFLTRLDSIVTGKRGDRIAPHKPLYLLYCIAKLQHDGPRLQPFSQVQRELGAALKLFGKPKSGVTPQYPFWRLQHDGLAEVVADGCLEARQGNTDPNVSSLLRSNARGGLVERYHTLLVHDERLRIYVVRRILDVYFPPELHEEVLRFFDLTASDLPNDLVPKWPVSFKDKVITAYGGVCSVSGYSATWEGKPTGVDATPLFWPISEEICTVSSAIALSPLCAKFYHLGFLALDADYRVMVSHQLREPPESKSKFSELRGMMIQLPARHENYPSQQAMAQHRRWVFKE